MFWCKVCWIKKSKQHQYVHWHCRLKAMVFIKCQTWFRVVVTNELFTIVVGQFCHICCWPIGKATSGDSPEWQWLTGCVRHPRHLAGCIFCEDFKILIWIINRAYQFAFHVGKENSLSCPKRSNWNNIIAYQAGYIAISSYDLDWDQSSSVCGTPVETIMTGRPIPIHHDTSCRLQRLALI